MSIGHEDQDRVVEKLYPRFLVEANTAAGVEVQPASSPVSSQKALADAVREVEARFES